MHWDNSPVLCEIISRSFQNSGWNIVHASNWGERKFYTYDGETIFPDIVVEKEGLVIFAEVKSRLFHLRKELNLRIIYHFAPEPECIQAFKALTSKDYRDKGPCEFIRLVKAAKNYADKNNYKALSVVITPSYVCGEKLRILKESLRKIEQLQITPIELWILYRKGKTNMHLKPLNKSIIQIPPIPEYIVAETFKKYIVVD